jgi:WD40 repeat protein
MLYPASIMAVSPDLISRVRHFSIESHCLKAGYLGELAVFAGADGRISFLDDTLRHVSVHPDGLLVSEITADALVTGGEDGRIMRTTSNGSILLADAKGQWIDALAAGPDGAIAWAAGKTVSARDNKGRVRVMSAPTTPQGLAFLPKGYRLAIPHYNGASLWFPNTDAEPEAYAWKGSHLDVTVSPDGRYLVTSMQENALHGWRVTDKAHMRMTGYPAKTRSMSWSHDGNWLATSGAEAAIIWPFSGKDGPMGKAPRECGVRPKRVSQVAFHPLALVLAIGYEDGFVMLVRLTDASELAVRVPKPGDKAGAITALAWDKMGRSLALGGADGYIGVLTLP